MHVSNYTATVYGAAAHAYDQWSHARDRLSDEIAEDMDVGTSMGVAAQADATIELLTGQPAGWFRDRQSVVTHLEKLWERIPKRTKTA